MLASSGQDCSGAYTISIVGVLHTQVLIHRMLSLKNTSAVGGWHGCVFAVMLFKQSVRVVTTNTGM